MQLIFPILVKPYVKKFIAGSYDVDPFVISIKDPYGLFLYNCLQKPTKKILGQEDLPVVCHELRRANIYSEKLYIQISEDFWNQKGCIITEVQQYHFNKFVAYLFHDEFYKYVRNRIGNKGSINRAILNFRELYSISEDELSFKTIQRAFQRRNRHINTSLSA